MKKKNIAFLAVPRNLYIGDGEGDGEGGEGGEAGGGEGGADITKSQAFIDAMKVAVESALSSQTEAHNTATQGLKDKNEALLGKNKDATDKLASFGDYDPEVIQTMMKSFNSSEEAKLIGEGKFDELIARRTDSMKAKHDDIVTTMQAALTKASDDSIKFKSRLDKNTIQEEVRKHAVAANALPGAIGDILRSATDVFTVTDDGEIEARDINGKLMYDNEMLVEPERFVNALMKTHPHYWPKSEGGGAGGSDADGFSGNDGLARLAEYAKSPNFDQAKYREMSAKVRGVKTEKR